MYKLLDGILVSRVDTAKIGGHTHFIGALYELIRTVQNDKRLSEAFALLSMRLAREAARVAAERKMVAATPESEFFSLAAPEGSVERGKKRRRRK